MASVGLERTGIEVLPEKQRDYRERLVEREDFFDCGLMIADSELKNATSPITDSQSPTMSRALKTFIVGTERSPLPESEALALGLSPSPDPARTLLESLAAENLARKAGFRLNEFSISQFPRPTDMAGRAIPPEDARPFCSDAAAKDLSLMLSGRYAAALPEFLDLLAQKNLRLPPEYLPELLEKAERDPALAELLRPALGARGEWLARQNPRWNALTADEETDWFTASFSERKRLLAATRARNPLLALAWLEKTWPEEKADHKAQFVDILRTRLSPLDEDFLEKTFLDKNREVRRAALELLALLPESRIFQEMKVFFKEKLAKPVKQNRKPDLEKSLPDLSEETVQVWLSVLSKNELSDWRNELLRLFVSILPPDELLSLTERSPEKLLESLDDTKDAAAFLKAIVRHKSEAWTEPTLRHFSRDFRHAVWQTKEMAAFLTLFAAETMAFLQKNKLALGYDNQAILRAVENCRHSWPKSLLENLLAQYRPSAYGNGEIPGWQFAAVLQTAAYFCQPAEAANSTFVRDYLQNPPKARAKELEEFLAVVRFRLGFRGHFRH
jgi:hypothetical protein